MASFTLKIHCYAGFFKLLSFSFPLIQRQCTNYVCNRQVAFPLLVAQSETNNILPFSFFTTVLREGKKKDRETIRQPKPFSLYSYDQESEQIPTEKKNYVGLYNQETLCYQRLI